MFNRESKRRSAGRATAFLATALALASCAPGDGTDEIESEQAALTTPLHRLGGILEPVSKVAAKMVDVQTSALSVTLPASVDLSAKMPPPGDQGGEGSCVGWGVAYATKTFDEVVEMKWAPNVGDHKFSPSWIYNQINHGVDKGSSVSDALNLLVNKGADTMSYFPYVSGSFTNQPDTASFTRAAHYKAQSWNTVSVSVQNFKSLLAGGSPIIVAFNVLPDMDAMNGTTNTVYDTTAGTRPAQSFSPCNGAACTDSGGTCNASTNVCTIAACTTAPCSRGGHVTAIVGYDDATSTFKFINSWGSTWNATGFGAFSYGVITDGNLGLQASVVVDKANTPGLQDSVIIWDESTGSLL